MQRHEAARLVMSSDFRVWFSDGVGGETEVVALAGTNESGERFPAGFGLSSMASYDLSIQCKIVDMPNGTVPLPGGRFYAATDGIRDNAIRYQIDTVRSAQHILGVIEIRGSRQK